MQKGSKIAVGVLSGTLLVGALFGCLYGFNSSVRGWVDNNINTITKDVPEEFKKVTIENDLELTSEQIKAQGVQSEKDVDPAFNLKFDLKHLPTDFDGDDTLVTKVVTGNEETVYFTLGDGKAYSSLTHKAGDEFDFSHLAFEKSGKKETYLLKTYWASYPDICVNTELTFKSDYKIVEEEKDNSTQDTQNSANARLRLPAYMVLKAANPNQVTIDGSCELTGILLPEDATNKTLVWSVSNPKLSLSATKTQSGDAVTITASEAYEGALQVMAKAENDYKIFATCEVYFPLEA